MVPAPPRRYPHGLRQDITIASVLPMRSCLRCQHPMWGAAHTGPTSEASSRESARVTYSRQQNISLQLPTRSLHNLQVPLPLGEPLLVLVKQLLQRRGVQGVVLVDQRLEL